MATFVKDILTESRTIATGVLPSTFQRLKYIYDVTRLDIRTGKEAFGFRPLGAVPTDTVTKSFTFDQDFELVLTDTIARGEGDIQREDAIDNLYDQSDEVMKQMMLTKINLSNFVLSVTQPGMSEPELFDDNKLVVLRTQYVVKYRSLL